MIPSLCAHTYGSRVVVRALEVGSAEVRSAIAKEVAGSCSSLMENINGAQVLQTCISLGVCVTDVMEAMCPGVARLSTHPYASRCVQRLLQHAGGRRDITEVVDPLIAEAVSLSQDQFGAHVMQHVVMSEALRATGPVAAQVRGRLPHLITHRHACSVVEKLYEHAAGPVRAAMIEDLSAHLRSDGVTGLSGAVMDQYGNYAVARMFEVSEASERALLTGHLRAHVSFLSRSLNGKHFIAQLVKGGAVALSPPMAVSPRQQPQHQPQQQQQQQQQASSVTLPPAIQARKTLPSHIPSLTRPPQSPQVCFVYAVFYFPLLFPSSHFFLLCLPDARVLCSHHRLLPPPPPPTHRQPRCHPCSAVPATRALSTPRPQDPRRRLPPPPRARTPPSLHPPPFYATTTPPPYLPR